MRSAYAIRRGHRPPDRERARRRADPTRLRRISEELFEREGRSAFIDRTIGEIERAHLTVFNTGSREAFYRQIDHALIDGVLRKRGACTGKGGEDGE